MKNNYLFLLLVLWIQASSAAQYCKPYCDSACTGPMTNCNPNCFSPYTNTGGGTSPCTLNSPNLILFGSELTSDLNFVPTGFISTSPLASLTCTSGGQIYIFLGPFVANNYVYKEYAGIGTSHFQIDVLWSFGLFGSWTGQQLSSIFTDGNGVVTQMAIQGQSCGAVPTASPAFATCTLPNGCFVNKKMTITHSTDFLSVNFSSMGSAISSSSAVQAWGIKDLIIVVSKCDSSCLTCSGSLATNCMSCQSGLYLQGSICILTCPFYTMPSNGTCVTSCPAYYYINTYNSFCEPCPINCPTCLNSTTCIDWSSGNDISNVLRDYLAVWIILGVVGLILISILLWKCCFSKKTFYDAMEEEVIDQKRIEPRPSRVMNQSTEKMEARWVEDIDELHLPKNHAKRVKNPGHIQGIGIELTNLQ